MKKLTKILFLILLVSALRYPLNATYAAVPHLINYQGRLTDSSNNPLTGSYAITFRIYDAETAGNLLWEEAQTGVLVQKGIFNILLGSVTNLNLAFDKPYFLEIKVGSEVMAPRQRMTSAGYAIKAEKTETADQAQNANTVANVGVSTTPAANKILPLDSSGKLPMSALKTYDSGWFTVSTATSYAKTHNLGTTKVLATLSISNNSDGSGYCVQTTGADVNGSNIYQASIVALTTTTVTLRTGPQSLFHGFTSEGTELDITSGYARIIMLALE